MTNSHYTHVRVLCNSEQNNLYMHRILDLQLMKSRNRLGASTALNVNILLSSDLCVVKKRVNSAHEQTTDAKYKCKCPDNTDITKKTVEFSVTTTYQFQRTGNAGHGLAVLSQVPNVARAAADRRHS